MKKLFIFILLLQFLLPQYYYFGKNKVTYRKFNWKILKTPHFNIYYDRDMADIAKECAKIAEEASARHSAFYEHELTEIVPIVLYNTPHDFANNNISPMMIDETTGGFTEILRNRVVIPFNGKYEDFHHVIFHELSHAFQINIIYGDMMSSSLGKMARRQPPLWTMEGLSEFITMRDHGEVNMYERDGIMTGVMPSLMDMNDLYTLGYRTYYVYRGGQAFFNWMSEEYGDDKVSHFFHKLSKMPDTDAVFQEVLGMDMTEVNRKWFLYMKRKHWPKILNQEDPILRDKRYTRHFVDLSSFNFKPVFGKNDRYIYFITNKKIYAQIVKFDTIEKKIVKVIASAEKETSIESIVIMNQTLSFNADRSVLHFTTRKGDRFYFNLYDVKKNRYIKKIPVKFNAVFEARINADGNKIVFSGNRDNQLDIYVYDIEKRDIIQITDDAYSDLEPDWSPDGKKIVYSGNRDFSRYSFKRNLYVYDMETKQTSPLTVSDARDAHPSWSDDGKYIAFVSERGGASDLYVKDLDESVLYRISEVVGGISAPAWSDDGKKICYAGFHAGGYDIYTTRVDLKDTNYVKEKIVEELDSQEEKGKYVASLALDDSRRFPFYYKSRSSLLSDYNPTLYPDSIFAIFGMQSSAGLGGRFLISLSDMLNDNLVFADTSLSYSRGNKLFDTDTHIQYINIKYRWNFGLYTTIVQQNYFYWWDETDTLDPQDINNWAGYQWRNIALGGFLEYPFTKYSRLTFSLAPAYIARELRERHREQIEDEYTEFAKPAMQSSIAFTHDNTLNGMLHPVDNGRSKLLIEGAPPLTSRGVFLNYLKVLLDVRRYALVTRYSSFALRFMWGGIWGRDKDVFDFQVGGGPLHPNWPTLRGYPIAGFNGSYMHLLNLEYRSTFLEFAQFRFPFRWPLRNINMVLFMDIGSAYSNVKKYRWMHFRNNRMIFDDLKVGLGFGIRFVFIFFPIMLDFSTPWTGYSINRLRHWNTFFNIGFDF